ncbi:MAG: hypothetical protein INR70_00525 [Parafilimonas terrae]|nr:hypothetical protein [Parafilimonas terrae]
MSTEPGLGEALAQAQVRLAEQLAAAPELQGESEAHRILRLVAATYGHDADKVVASFNRGGALADLVRAVLQVVPRTVGTAGAPERPETVRAHAMVHALMQHGLPKGKAIAQVAKEEDTSVETIKGRLRRRHKKISGVITKSDNPANTMKSPGTQLKN